jgi:NitT/TauT family transport system permease protein
MMICFKKSVGWKLYYKPNQESQESAWMGELVDKKSSLNPGNPENESQRPRTRSPLFSGTGNITGWIPHLLFGLILILEVIPLGYAPKNPWYLKGLLLLIETGYLGIVLWRQNPDRKQTAGDITAVVFSVILVWELCTTKFELLDKMLFPAPEKVIGLFIEDIPVLLKGFVSSMGLLTAGYISALALAIPLALVIGWRKRLFRAVNPLTKVLGPIPPIVYIPYAIALLPTFRTASMFIIFIGAFWPIFINTLNGVFNIDQKLIDSAKTLNVNERTMLYEVILPGTLPAIISGATIGLVLSFILLTAAEMIGATSGLGWYVKYFSDFSDYPRVIVGIIFIGMVVTGITWLFGKAERYLLRWRK